MSTDRAKCALRKTICFAIVLILILSAAVIFFMVKEPPEVSEFFFRSLVRDLRKTWFLKLGIGAVGFLICFLWCYFVEERDAGRQYDGMHTRRYL